VISTTKVCTTTNGEAKSYIGKFTAVRAGERYIIGYEATFSNKIYGSIEATIKSVVVAKLGFDYNKSKALSIAGLSASMQAGKTVEA